MYGTELLLETTSILLLVVLALVSLWWLSTRRPAGVPPGPGFVLPVLGHLHLMRSSDPRQKFAKWRQHYGDVFSLYLGSQLVVVLNGYKVIKDALVKHADAFSDRPHLPAFDMIKSKGISNSSGSAWKAQRQTSLDILRELGMGKNILAENVQTEVKEFIKAIAESKGQPQDLTQITQVSVSNNICSIVLGRRFEYEDNFFKRYIQVLNAFSANVSSVSLSQLFPALRFLPGDPLRIRTPLDRMALIMDNLLQPIIDAHVNDYDENCVEDFISRYIRETRKVQHKPLAEYISEVNLKRVVFDLFAAGTEKTSTSIRWAIAYFLHHPDVQDKCYEEIHRVVGTERAPTIHDRTELVYLEATILEVMRYSDIVPLSVPHSTAYDVEFRGYTIPKGSLVIPNLSSVLHAPEIWEDPDNFRPRRFIGQDGKLLRFEELIPFSIGQRMCLGEGLARMELFLYLATMIQRFRFLPPETGELPSLRRNFSIIVSPDPFKVRAAIRK